MTTMIDGDEFIQYKSVNMKKQLVWLLASVHHRQVLDITFVHLFPL